MELETKQRMHGENLQTRSTDKYTDEVTRVKKNREDTNVVGYDACNNIQARV